MESAENISKSIEAKKEDLINLDFLIPDLSEETILQEKIIKILSDTRLNNIAKAVNMKGILSELYVNSIIYRMAELFNQLQFEQSIDATVVSLIKDEGLKICLLFLVKASAEELKNFIVIEKVASRAITILNAARVSFSGMDLSSICIPGADLSNSIFDGTQLQGADLSGVQFQQAWLHEANLSRTQLKGINFGEWPSLELKNYCNQIAYSPEGQWLGVTSGFEVLLFDVSSRVLKQTFLGHTNFVISVAFSISGMMASGSQDNTIKLWDTKDGKELKTLIGHRSGISTIAFSTDGEQLASGDSQEMAVKLWDTKTGVELRKLVGHTDGICCLAFNTEGILASGSGDNTIKLWDIKNGKILKTLLGSSWTARVMITSVAFNAEGILAAASNNGIIRLWDKQWALLKDLAGHTQPVFSLAFSNEGILASGGGDNTVKLWDIKNEKAFKTLSGHAQGSACFSSIALNSGGILAAATNDKIVKLWDIKSGKALRLLSGHPGRTPSITFNAEGVLASGSRDRTIKLWDVENGKILKTLLGHTAGITAITFSNEGLLASGSEEGAIKLWDTKNGKVLKNLWDNASSWKLLKNLWSKRSWKALKSILSGPFFLGHNSEITSLAFNVDGTILASASYDNTIKVWDVKNGGKLKTLLGHASEVTSVSFSLEGILASGSRDRTIKLWDTKSGNELKTLSGHAYHVTSVSFNVEGALISGSWDGSIKLWNTENGKELCTLRKASLQQVAIGHSKEGINSVVCSLENNLISANYDNTLRLWDLSTIGGSLGVLKQGENYFVTLASEPLAVAWNKTEFGEFIATSHANGAVCCWRMLIIKQKIRLQLLWSSHYTGLNLENVYVEKTVGLSENNLLLLQQRGAIGIEHHVLERSDKLTSPSDPITGSINLEFLKIDLETEDMLQKKNSSILNYIVLNNIAKAVGVVLPPETEIDAIIYRITDLINQLQFEQSVEVIAKSLLNNLELKNCLLLIVKASANVLRDLTNIDVVAAKTITILNAAKVSFSGMDLSNIQIPGADLSSGIFDGTNFQKANLRGVKFQGAWLRAADLSNATIEDVDFGERPYMLLPGEIHDCSYSKDGQWLAVASGNNMLLYKADKMQLIQKVVWDDKDGAIHSVAFSPTALQISATHYNNIYNFDMSSGKLLSKFECFTDKVICTIAFSPDGNWLVSGGYDPKIYIWNYITQKFEDYLKGHKYCVNQVSFNPDGEMLASCSRDSTIRLWDFRTKACLKIFEEHRSYVECLSFSPDGHRLVSGSHNKTIGLWDILSRTLIKMFKAHDSGVYGVLRVAFSPNRHGKQIIASGGGDSKVCLINADTGELLKTFEGHRYNVNGIAFSPNGEELVSGSKDCMLRIWSVINDKGLTFKSHTTEIRNIAFNSNSRLLISIDRQNTICSWEPKTGQLISSVEIEALGSDNTVLLEQHYSSVVCMDKTLRHYNLSGNLLHNFETKELTIQRCAFSLNGQYIATWSQDEYLQLWHANTGKIFQIFDKPIKNIDKLVFSRDAKRLAIAFVCVGYNPLQVWECESGKILKELITIKDTYCRIHSIDFSPDGEELACGVEENEINIIKKWNIASGELIGNLKLKISYSGNSKQRGYAWLAEYPVLSLAFSPDSKHLALSGLNQSLRILSHSLESIRVINTDFLVTSIHWFGIDKVTFLATGGDNASINIWQVEPLSDYDNGDIKIKLLWTSYQGALHVVDTCIQRVEGLSEKNETLLKQRGAIGEPQPTKKYEGVSALTWLAPRHIATKDHSIKENVVFSPIEDLIPHGPSTTPNKPMSK